LKRRKAIRQLGLGLSAGLLAPQLLSSCKKETMAPKINYKDSVAVIGAGAAGLYAADILMAQGLNVFVLEASSRSGGRIRSFSSNDITNNNATAAYIYDNNYPPLGDFPVELGGDIVYGSDSALGKIISVLSIPMVDLGGATDEFFLGGQVNTASGWQGDADFNAVENFISTFSSNTNNVSIQAAAGVTPRAQNLLNSQASNLYGSTYDLVSASGVAGELLLRKHDTKRLTVKTNTLQDILLSRFNNVVNKVKLNTPVASIDYSGDSIVITDINGKQYQAGKVIITVPLTVLKDGDISFNPPLPATNATAASKFGMDPAFRMIVDFKTNFWGSNSGFLWGGSFGPQYMNGGFNRTTTYNSTLVITAFGQPAKQLSMQPGSTAVNLILNELNSLYPDRGGMASYWVRKKVVVTNGVPQETDPIVTSYDWFKEPFIRGGISYPLVGATHQDRINLGTNVNGKLFFAGEATDTSGDAGTISGALNSAERATTDLIKSITG
jgi:monoamine oxidase